MDAPKEGLHYQVPMTLRLQLCELAAQNYALALKEHWIEEDGFSGWRWERYDIQLRIVCAANRYKDLIIMGTRHSAPSMYAHIDLIGLDALLEYCQGDKEQGFVDQYGLFHSRSAARIIYEASGGKPARGEWTHPTKLFSEDLY